MGVLDELDGMLKLSKQMLDKQKDLVAINMGLMDKDDSVSEEDKAFIKSINKQVNNAIKNGDSAGLKSIMDQLTNKMTT
jgi:hypothetical protein